MYNYIRKIEIETKEINKMCICGHSISDHLFGGDKSCCVEGCECKHYEVNFENDEN